LNDLKNEESYHFIKADICDGDAVLKALEEYEVDAESHVDRSIDGPGPFVQTNVVGTLQLL
tara:strand:- start:794 stop:976 length:183 start_codon:yes stop_codon:yes gene_type:complete